MKKILFFFLFSSFLASGQNNPDAKRDYVWVFGNNFYPPCNNEYIFDFNNSPIVSSFNHNIHLYVNNASISDTSGSLLFFTNGEEVVDRLGNVMPNGDSLAYTDWNQYLAQFDLGPSWPQSVLILPNPGYSNIYYIFHLRIEWINGLVGHGPIATGLMMSTVDMNLNNGYGDVINKNQLLIDDTLQNGIVATRHGNGRDWWILVPTYHIGSFYEIKLDPESPTVIPPPISGPFDELHEPYVGFSPDGSKLVYGYNGPSGEEHNMSYFSFNRCDGSISLNENFVCLSSPGWSVAISPNSRLLYIASELYMYQYDLDATNVSSTETLVATYDGYSSSSNPPLFDFMLLGPDNRIYLGAGHSNFVHVIENPNVEGIGCNVVQRAFSIPSNNLYGSMPNIPNFRLGRWIGSPCDPLSIDENGIKPSQTIHIKASPNPASETIRFELNVVNNFKPMEFVIYDNLGRETGAITVGQFQGFINYPVSHLSDGVYFGLLKDQNEILGRVKFVVKK